jgi:DNA-binding transcriptional MerR regulator
MTEIQAKKRARHAFSRIKKLLENGFSADEIRQFLAGVILDAAWTEKNVPTLIQRYSKWDKPRGRPCV